jgi:hypothetical protein
MGGDKTFVYLAIGVVVLLVLKPDLLDSLFGGGESAAAPPPRDPGATTPPSRNPNDHRAGDRPGETKPDYYTPQGRPVYVSRVPSWYDTPEGQAWLKTPGARKFKEDAATNAGATTWAGNPNPDATADDTAVRATAAGYGLATAPTEPPGAEEGTEAPGIRIGGLNIRVPKSPPPPRPRGKPPAPSWKAYTDEPWRYSAPVTPAAGTWAGDAGPTAG